MASSTTISTIITVVIKILEFAKEFVKFKNKKPNIEITQDTQSNSKLSEKINNFIKDHTAKKIEQ